MRKKRGDNKEEDELTVLPMSRMLYSPDIISSLLRLYEGDFSSAST